VPGIAHTSSLLAWIIFLPLLGAAFNGIFGRRLKQSTVTMVGVGSVLGSFVMAAIEVVRLMSLPDADFLSITLWEWFGSGNVGIDMAFMLDHLSAVMLLIVTGVGTLIHVFSTGYMRKDDAYWKYFAYLNLFMFSMLLLILGKNLAVLFVGWEGVGLCSYLLIGFWYKDGEKAEAGQKAFVVNRIGDLAFLVGTFLVLFYAGGNLDFLGTDGVSGGIRGAVDHLSASSGGDSTITLIGILFFIAAAGKSAQVPLYVWLPDAMAGPTPVSALIHAATMVTAGVYVMCRMSYLFVASPDTMMVVALVGGFTALFAATIALVQNDIKKVLAYSTVSQIGFMVLAVGCGAWVAAVFHLMTHAFFKACLFLGSGSVIHAMHHEQDIRNMGALRKKLPITAGTFFVSCLAIAGIPFFSGFFSKDEILYNSLTTMVGAGGPNSTFQTIAGVMGFLAAACTAFYMFRLYYLTFEGEYRGDQHTWDHAHEERAMTVPLLILGALAAGAGFLGIPHIIHGAHILDAWLSPVFAGTTGVTLLATENPDAAHLIEIIVMVGSSLMGIAAMLIARKYYHRPAAALPRAPTETTWHRVLTNKYYVDEFYHAVFVRGIRGAARFLHETVDVKIIDGLFVRGTAQVVGFVGKGLRKFQTGDTQAYVAVFVVGLAAALLIAS